MPDRPQPGTRDRPIADVAVVVSVLTGTNVAAYFAPGSLQTLIVPLGAVVLVVLGRHSGLSWDDIGLGRRHWWSGARYGGAAAGVVVGAVAVGALLPGTRAVFLDERYHNNFGAALLLALVSIPLQTVVPEELAFRGVLLATLARSWGTAAAAVVSSALFGLWHISSSLGLAAAHENVSGQLGGGMTTQVSLARCSPPLRPDWSSARCDGAAAACSRPSGCIGRLTARPCWRQQSSGRRRDGSGAVLGLGADPGALLCSSACA